MAMCWVILRGLYKLYILTTLHCSKVSFLQCCYMKIYNKIFTKMWGVYSLLRDTVYRHTIYLCGINEKNINFSLKITQMSLLNSWKKNRNVQFANRSFLSRLFQWMVCSSLQNHSEWVARELNWTVSTDSCTKEEFNSPIKPEKSK